MKRIVFVIAILAAAAVGTGYAARPEEAARYAAAAAEFARQAWDQVRASPGPAALALGTFVLTVLFHKAKGKTLRESVEVAATRVTVVPIPPPAVGENETPVVKRAKARATRAQLLADQIGLQNRLRKVPEEVVKAEKDVCYTQQAVTDAKRVLADKHKVHNGAVARLKTLRKELDAGEAELVAIEA